MAINTEKQHSRLKHIDFIILDLACTLIAYAIGFFVRFFLKTTGISFWTYSSFLFAFLILQVLLGTFLNNYSDILRRGKLKELIAVVKLNLATLALSVLFMYALHASSIISRLFLLVMMSTLLALMWSMRTLWKRMVISRIKKSIDHKKALFLITDSARVYGILEGIRKDFLSGLEVVGIALADGREQTEIDGIKVLNELDGATEYIRDNWVDNVLVYLPNNENLPGDFFHTCSEMNITVQSVLSIEDVETKKISVETVGGKTVLTTGYTSLSFNQSFFKRAFDIFGGFIGSIFAVLIIMIVGPFIYIKSPGPIIFKQTRIGKNGKRFTFYKIRSMRLDAEELKESLASQNKSADGMMFKMDFDPRIIGNRVLPDGTKKTGIGEFIRKTSLDEFPQFFNVLKGDMSLVGTRPPTVDEWKKYEFHHRARLIMKPGITGMWQTSGRSNVMDFEEVVKLDLKYIRNFSLSEDAKIIWKTVVGLIKREGAV